MTNTHLIDGKLYIKNFLSEKEVDLLLATIKHMPEEVWNQGNSDPLWVGRVFHTWMLDDTYQEYKDAIDKVELRVKSLFTDYSVIHPLCVHRHLVGDSLSSHADADPKDEIRSTISFGLVIYLNSDFEGGKLVYPDLQEEVTPEPGAIAIHLGDVEHLVTEITAGTRYSLTSSVFGLKTALLGGVDKPD